jgi:hypothetical protein
MLTRAPLENSTTIAGSAFRAPDASTTTAGAKPPDPPPAM